MKKSEYLTKLGDSLQDAARRDLGVRSNNHSRVPGSLVGVGSFVAVLLSVGLVLYLVRPAATPGTNPSSPTAAQAVDPATSSAHDEGTYVDGTDSESDNLSIALDVVHTPSQSPVVQSIAIRNLADDPIDISGWALATVGYKSRGITFPAGTVISGNGSFGVFQVAFTDEDCPAATAKSIWLCYDPFGGPRQLSFPGGGIELRSAAGDLIAEWAP